MTVYQEDYKNLLQAAETGRCITYSPTDIITIMSDFDTNLKDGIKQVRQYQLFFCNNNHVFIILFKYFS